MGEFVDGSEHPVSPSIMGAVLDEVVGPDEVGSLGAQADGRSVSSQRRPFLGCLAGTFSPSRRQIRLTRLSLTTQPDWLRSSSAILW